jgi:hypothetical protein
MFRSLTAAIALTLLPTASLAQDKVKPLPTQPVSVVEQNCIQRWQNTVPCARIAAYARSRYGENVNGYQWQSASGAVWAKVRQGK